MADDAVSLRDINWREAFPFTHLFRAFRIAVHPSKLILALVALGCLWCGGLVLDAIWAGGYQVMPADFASLEVRDRQAADPAAVDQQLPTELRDILRHESESQGSTSHRSTPRGIFHTFFMYEVARADNVLMFREPPFESIWQFIAIGPTWLWSHHWLFALIYTAWFLLVWSIFGGAIARIAAVHAARDEKISVRHALTFSVSKVLSFIFAPVIPVLIIFAIGIAISIAGTVLLHIPWAGPIILGLLFFLALIGGFVITLVLLGTIGGFNLMYPTVGVEGSDSFDAISRSFSYVFARPWRMLWYTVVAVVYGAICYLFVRFFVWLLLGVTWFFMSWLLGAQHLPPNDKSPADIWPRIWSHPADPMTVLTYSPDYEHLKGTEAVAAGLIVWWNYILIGLIGAFAISFYFSSNTIIYYLMRREVDATELDDVYVEETEDELEEPAAPAAGAPASNSGVLAESTSVQVVEPVPSTEALPPAEPPTP